MPVLANACFVMIVISSFPSNVPIPTIKEGKASPNQDLAPILVEGAFSYSSEGRVDVCINVSSSVNVLEVCNGDRGVPCAWMGSDHSSFLRTQTRHP